MTGVQTCALPICGDVQPLFDDFTGYYTYLGSRQGDGTELFFRTTRGAPRGKVIAVDLGRAGAARERVVVPEGPDVIESASLVAGTVLVTHLHDAHAQVSRVDAASGRVLTVAWMNREALRLTAETGEVHYWSRSRKKLWHKGEESGHVQKVKSIRLDCDEDVVLVEVEQVGGIACHTGRASCFFNHYQDGKWVAVDPVIRDPKEIYGQ